jgi:branched-chain amino acid transport system substrate-binding protein
MSLASLASAQEVVKIGHVAAVTGPVAYFGKDTENGARLAIDALNARAVVIAGKKVRFELVAEDDAGEPRQATTVAQKLVDARVNGVVGHQTSGTTIPASNIYFTAGIPQISHSSTSPKYTRQGFNTTFRVVANDTQLGRALARYAVKAMAARRVAVIDDRTAYGQGLAAEFCARVHERQGNRLQCNPDENQGDPTGPGFLWRHERRRRADAAPDEAARDANTHDGRRRHLFR